MNDNAPVEEQKTYSVQTGHFMDLEPDMVSGTRYVRRMVEGLHHMVCIVEAEPGWVTKGHDHYNDETLYILRGQMTLVVDGETIVIKQGDYIYIPPNVHHMGTVGPEGMTQLKVFSPPRTDYINKTDDYLRNA
ncbi:MAG: cupin domain-containing protein [Immundisolibacteraceae bacterium]|nr:cupin domain-containing protein [Immundisolibacteraceae bacterium]